MAVITFNKRYNVQCLNCDFGDFEVATSREAAHELAANHIHEGRNGYRPNEEHEVEITEIEVGGVNV